VALPVHLSHSKSVPLPARAAAAALQPSPAVSLNVHVVTDSEALSEGLAQLARSGSAGMLSLSFSSCRAGISPILEAGVDALVIDIGGGGAREMEFLRRAIAIGPAVPVIAVGRDELALQEQAMRAGAEDCLNADLNAPRAIALALRRAIMRRELRDDVIAMPRIEPSEPQVTLVQEAADAIVILDSDGTVKFANQAAEELLGRKGEDMIGKAFGLPSETGAHDVAVLRPDGDNRYAEMRIIETKTGGVAARVAALNDVTVRHKLEHTMMVAQNESKRNAKRSQSFFSNVNHDLRTPLTHIIGFSELMKNEQFGPIGQNRYREYASDIHASGRMLLEMIEDLLGIAEAETDEVALSDEICNLGQLVEIAVASQRQAASARGVSIEIDCPQRLPGLRGDAKRLRQGFFRLIAEAVHCARPQAKLRLRVSTENDSLAVLLEEVGEHGVVQSMLALHDEDEAFVSAEESGQPREDGLSLSLTRKVMELHGGTLTAQGGVKENFNVPMRITLRFPQERVIR
jgi:signal transduction histidine kinase